MNLESNPAFDHSAIQTVCGNCNDNPVDEHGICISWDCTRVAARDALFDALANAGWSATADCALLLGLGLRHADSPDPTTMNDVLDALALEIHEDDELRGAGWGPQALRVGEYLEAVRVLHRTAIFLELKWPLIERVTRATIIADATDPQTPVGPAHWGTTVGGSAQVLDAHQRLGLLKPLDLNTDWLLVLSAWILNTNR